MAFPPESNFFLIYIKLETFKHSYQWIMTFILACRWDDNERSLPFDVEFNELVDNWWTFES